MPSKCEYFHKLKTLGLSPKTVKAWLAKHPPPRGWKHSAWRWAYEQMPLEV